MQEGTATSRTGQNRQILSQPEPDTSLGTRPTDCFVAFRKEDIEQSIPERFEQQVRTHAHRLAVRTRIRTLTYDALNRAANQVARALLAQRDVGEEPIALLLNNDADMIVSILAVLKAGKIYVPMEPAHPPARNALVLQDSQAKLIVTNDRHRGLAEELNERGLQMLNVDELGPDLAADDLCLSISPGTQAHILYTSGSTGQPKGIVTNHRNLLHDVMAATNDLHLCVDDRMILMQSPCFGTSRHKIFGALLNGAALFPYEIREEGLANLADWLIQEEITYYGSAVTTFRYFASTLTGNEEFPNLRLVCLGGESLYPRDVELFKRHFYSNCTLVNGLGATETGRVMHRFIDKDAELEKSVAYFDRVVEDCEVLVFDESGRPAGLDCTGEIIVRSPYLALGYWGRPDLTQAAFLPDPEGGQARMFHTGDLGRALPDGRFVHLGRKDFQVKIRGQRVEVSEIEMALQDHYAIKDAVVSAFERLPGEKALVAYIVPGRQPLPTGRELRSFLGKKLPESMVPSAYVMLDALPLTVSGKVDRRALPAPDWSKPELQQAFVAPRTPVEELLADTWAQVLGVDRVGIHDNFFELGGHSLLATQINSRLRDALRVELPLPTILERPTVSGLAKAVETAMTGDAELRPRQITPLSRESRRATVSSSSMLVIPDDKEIGV